MYRIDHAAGFALTTWVEFFFHGSRSYPMLRAEYLVPLPMFSHSLEEMR